MSRSTGAERRVLHSLKHLPIALPQVARMWTHQRHTVWASFSITLPHEETAPARAALLFRMKKQHPLRARAFVSVCINMI